MLRIPLLLHRHRASGEACRISGIITSDLLLLSSRWGLFDVWEVTAVYSEAYQDNEYEEEETE